MNRRNAFYETLNCVCQCRACNCDLMDNELRSDVGILTVLRDLPVKGFQFSLKENVTSFANLSVGPLFCAADKFGKVLFTL
jgi:hypothetical protein